MNQVKIKLKPDNLPKIAMGDFNAEANEKWYTHLPEFGIIDAVQSHHGKLPDFTYNSGKGNSKYIDFFLLWNINKESVQDVFVGIDPINPVDYSAIKYMPSEKVPSDHLPVTIKINFNAEQ